MALISGATSAADTSVIDVPGVYWSCRFLVDIFQQVTKSQETYMRSFFPSYMALLGDNEAEQLFLDELGKKWLVKYPVPTEFENNPENVHIESAYTEFVQQYFRREAIQHQIMCRDQSDTDEALSYETDDPTLPVYEHTRISVSAPSSPLPSSSMALWSPLSISAPSSPLPSSSPIALSSPSYNMLSRRTSPVEPSSKRPRSPESPLKRNGRSRIA
ncbi:hypothetical protein C8J56DRAFT_1063951 [Mycena floridula]|nr:hypothetical protein C8J56DRAFT_1063951 [Mycena floridula]